MSREIDIGEGIKFRKEDNYLIFNDIAFGMYLNLHKSEVKLFIKHKPFCVTRDIKFRLSTSNNITRREAIIISEYLIRNHNGRKYKKVENLMKSRTRLFNKRKMLLEDYSTGELVEYIESKKKGEPVCQN